MRTISATGIVLVFALLPALSHAQSPTRLPTIPPDQYDEAQKKAAADFLAARKVPLSGPFNPLMHSPQVLTAAREMGDYLRYKSSIGTTLSELVVIVTARSWTQDYEWSLHAPIAIKQGIKAEIVDAIADGRRPQGMSDDEEICYSFTTELLANKRVSDMTYARAQKRFGDKGVVDIAAISGYYTLLAMELNVAHTPPAPGGPTLRRFPD